VCIRMATSDRPRILAGKDASMLKTPLKTVFTTTLIS
jgi:hypothetical protein